MHGLRSVAVVVIGHLLVLWHVRLVIIGLLTHAWYKDVGLVTVRLCLHWLHEIARCILVASDIIEEVLAWDFASEFYFESLSHVRDSCLADVLLKGHKFALRRCDDLFSCALCIGSTRFASCSFVCFEDAAILIRCRFIIFAVCSAILCLLFVINFTVNF